MHLNKLYKLIPTFLTSALFTCFFGSCRHESYIIDELDTVCFESQVLPVIQTSCRITGCHDAESASGGFIAENYESIVKAVSPGNPFQSKLYSVLTDIYGDNMMPPDRPLTQQQRMLIHVWIAQGAMNTSCNDIPPPPPPPPDTNNSSGNPDTICFTQHILPIFQSSCGTVGCHDAITHEEGYVLTSYASIMQYSEAIVPFNPNESKIFKVVTENEEDDIMPPPPRQPLTANQIETLRKWIADGALNSDCPDLGGDTTGVISFSIQVWPVIENNCLSCHNAANPTFNIDLSSYSQVKLYSETLRNGVPVLMGVMKHLEGFYSMPPPPANKLSDNTIRVIELWIEQGTQNN